MLPNVPGAAATTPATNPAPADAVAPLMRGIAVLRRLTEADGTLSPSALEKATGLARSTVDRITATLARMGYVRLDGRDAVLAPRLMELGNAYLAALRLPRLLDAHADALADELDESVSLAVRDRDGVRFIHQATRRRAMSLSFRIGDLLPAERTAPGPLFATEWEPADWARWRTRRTADPEGHGFPAVPPRGGAYDDFEDRTARAGAQGWALDDQLIEPGLVAVSVPVRDPRTGRIACVANVVSHTSRHTAESLRSTLLPRLRAAVAAMEQELLREQGELRKPSPLPPPPPPATAPRPLAPAPNAASAASTPSAPSGLAAWTGASKQELGREFIESLARGLTVITSFGEGRAELTLTEVARTTGLARATARRALITLEHLGYVESSDRLFQLTPRVLGLGYPPLSMLPLPRIAAPHLAELSARVHDSTSLAILTEGGDEVQYTARVATSRIMSANITLGTRLPAYATSLGRVMLADLLPQAPLPDPLAALTPHTVTDSQELRTVLERVRDAGYALVDGELEEGLRSVAVPVREGGGRVVAAVNVAMHSSRRSVAECVEEVLPALRDAAGRIEGELAVAGMFRRVPEV
ncbi:helix-turn-helix domain-containing protein [Streptomyces sp. LBUM 1478]|uniref:IclR family transcriptional regulator domain-containing protein n=10 Tax=Streptomyces scabiei TaxID=1930 RepID=UPI000765FBF8|nr:MULTISPECIES: IclR family transcriptional regulator C-terminal domain-containing protein [Streptomyces]MBP5867879.1 helix-turn-helix domain-containing protein [Streptomyces sp. LBUM 1485]MBP5906410.1 helix-turn-helix domain-containing protein [Streptomyces sp. LBUM 1478]MBP5930920.1 helix-turn-helix domain-containing protein [Streptomyces sp. LBUM 1479]MBP5876365.1 helix-turn-helix domain-containing protein [Streptomyces sp. LBUM 1477]MBP5884111.1 helix-turn-helix domain-containing protein 